MSLTLVEKIATRFAVGLESGQLVRAGDFSAEGAPTSGEERAVRTKSRTRTIVIWTIVALVGAVSWGAATFALGRACCYYFASVRQGQIPPVDEMRRYYQDQIKVAEKSWHGGKAAPAPTAGPT